MIEQIITNWYNVRLIVITFHRISRTYHEDYCRRKEVEVDIEGLGLTKVVKIFARELVMLYIISYTIYTMDCYPVITEKYHNQKHCKLGRKLC